MLIWEIVLKFGTSFIIELLTRVNQKNFELFLIAVPNTRDYL